MGTINIMLNAIIQVVFFSIIPFIWWLLIASKKESFFNWIGLKKPVIKGSVLKLIFLVLIVSAVFILLMTIIMTQLMGDADTAITQFNNQGLKALPSILIFAIIQTSLSEEVFFRGFLAKRFINQLGFNVGNTIQALLFGLIHGIPFGLVTGNILVTILLIFLP